MRRILLQMMTTLDGRVDHPMAWVHTVGDDQYAAIDRLYAGCDTVLVGRSTYEEMAAYWPRTLAEHEGTATHRAMARRMTDYRKLVFSRDGRTAPTAWANTELAVTPTDAALADRLAALKAEPGGHLHLAGGASFASAVVALGLVDEFHLFVYPVVSPGATWMAPLLDRLDLVLEDVDRYHCGVVRLHYAAGRRDRRSATGFSELLS